jgi:diadenosine tetraphosphate (Ap4A) HIT family hydrolase
MDSFPSDPDCPFCQIQKSDPKKQIIAGQPASENFLAIRKLYPSKNVNFLVVSKVHVTNLKSGKNGVTRMVDMNNFVDFMN